MESAMGEGNDKDAKEKEKGAKEEGGGPVHGEHEQAAGVEEDDGKAGKQQQQKKKKGDGGSGGAEKQKSAVVLRVELHCQGCARKVKKAIQAAKGVEGVVTDMAASTVTVSGGGKVDPWELKERIEARTHKPVAFVSPPNPNPNPNPPKKKDKLQGDVQDVNKKPAGDDDKAAKSDDKIINKKKNKEAPAESTVVLRIGLHCNGCVDRIKRTAHKVKGVKQVTVDTGKEQVTVKGTMDANALPDVLRHKLKKEVAVVVVPASNNKDKDKKKKKQDLQDAEGENEMNNKAADIVDQQQGSGKKKKKKNNKHGDQEALATEQQHKEEDEFPATYGGGGYRVEMLRAPQLFSDENPNACALM